MIRVCHTTGTHSPHNDKSPPLNVQLGVGSGILESGILESPPASDYGGEVMMMTSRLSPRSTPSVCEEVESGMIPVCPPTSPSLSTNCSILADTRSRSGTPRCYPHNTVIKGLRGGSSGSQDPVDMTNCSIFPLPPPSLYFGTEPASLSPTSVWGTNSMPMCRVPPLFESCMDDHYCQSYKKCNFCMHPNSHDLSSRVLGDGNSLVSTPVPSIRKTPWSAEDLYAASSSCTPHTSPLHNCNHFLPGNNFNTPQVMHFDNDYSPDHHCNHSTLRPKQQYWV